MSEDDTDAVQFVCTDRGQHQRAVLGAWSMSPKDPVEPVMGDPVPQPDGLPVPRSQYPPPARPFSPCVVTMRNSRGGWTYAVTCPRCRREVRITDIKLAQFAAVAPRLPTARQDISLITF